MRSISISLLIFLLSTCSGFAGEPLKVFILAGQSNMEGHARIETFDYIGDDAATAPLLAKMIDEDGAPVVCERVWISYLTGRQEAGEGHGRLTAGYGSRPKPTESNGKIGPEFVFGITMEEELEGPILIIKTAWGGKSLFYDYRSPSAGVYPRTVEDVERNRNLEEDSGHYYRLMMNHVQSVLKDPGRVCPDYDPEDGYELAGFVWFQGFNDMVNRGVYPEVGENSEKPRFALYSELMATFIRDVRKDLNAENLPFVIGVMGVGGRNPNRGNAEFRLAMAAPAELEEFQGNVFAVPTAPFWDETLAQIDAKHAQVRQMAYYLRKEHKDHANRDGKMTPEEQRAYVKQYEADLISEDERELWQRGASNQGYHYLGCAKTFARMGEAFAHTLLHARSPEPAEAR